MTKLGYYSISLGHFKWAWYNLLGRRVSAVKFGAATVPAMETLSIFLLLLLLVVGLVLVLLFGRRSNCLLSLGLDKIRVTRNFAVDTENS